MHHGFSRARSIATVLTLVLAMAATAAADLVYVGDEAGHVGSYDTVTGTTSVVGSIASFNPAQVLGLAYDSATNSILILDRAADKVYTMNATTGVASLLFQSSGQFQGGAMSGGVLYGTQEGGTGTPVAGFSLTGTQVVNGSSTPNHTHAMGVDAATGQLYSIGTLDNTIRKINTDGTIGSSVVTATNLFGAVEDIDYWGGNFLVTQYSTRQIWQVDGVTGASSLFLTTAQLTAMGVTGYTTGVVVRVSAVPEPASLAMLGLGLAGIAGMAVRRLRPRA